MFNFNKIRFKFQVERYLRANLNQDICMLSKIFEENGYELYLVGGCIRDVFLRKTPKDYDLCTNLMPEKVIKLMKSKNIPCQLQGEHFGVVAVVLHDVAYEIATFRQDLNDTLDRNTNVRFGVGIEDDVLRRDFTINALFYNISKRKVIDLVNGILDLRKGVIRAVGDPNLRFAEDNLRKLRAIRFASRLKFKIEENTLKAIQDDPSLNVTLERVYNELATIYSSSYDLKYTTELLFDSKLHSTIFVAVPPIALDFVDYTTIKSFSCWIATIYKYVPTTAKGMLLISKFPTTICNNIEFLLKYCNAGDLEIKDFNPLHFYKQWQASSLYPEDILSFGKNANYLKHLVEFRPSTETTKKFQQQGYEGKDLGDALNQHYKLKYLIAIQHANSSNSN